MTASTIPLSTVPLNRLTGGRPARPSVVQTLRRQIGSFGSYGTFTFATAIAMETGWDLVRVLFANDSTSAAYTIDSMCLAPSAKYNDGYNPVTAAGAAVPFTPVTTNNSGSTTVYFDAQGSGASASLTVPVASVSGSLGIAATDWMAVSSLDRADDGETLPILMFRSYSSTSTRGPFVQTPNGAGGLADNVDGWPSVNQGRILKGFYRSGNHTVTTSGFTSPNENEYASVYAVQTYARTRGFSVMALGDSLTQGYPIQGRGPGWGFQACADISQLRRPVQWMNCGWQGQTTAEYTARGYAEFSALRPDVVCVCVSSPNGSSTTQADFDAMWLRVIAFASYVERNGGVPILVTAVPFNYAAGPDLIRKAINDRARNMGALGTFPVIDADAAVTDGASPARTKPEYLHTDNSHLNVAGHAAVAAVATPVLRRVLGV